MELEHVNNTVVAFWPVLGSVLFFVVWLVRLESKVLALENEKTTLYQQLKSVQDTLAIIATSLARLEGRLESRLPE